MILPLRQQHRRWFIVLGLFLPVTFAIGIAVRQPVAVVGQLPAGLAPSPAPQEMVWTRSGLFAKAPVGVSLLRERNSGHWAVQFSAAAGFLKPDLMVYWVAGNLPVAGALPENATLLGEFSSSALPLPLEATATNGMLVLYSLADNELVDESQPMRFTDATR
jgi:hypothetical protein